MKIEIDLSKKIRFASEEDIQKIREEPSYSVIKNNYTLIKGEALQQMSLLPDNSIDLICVDLPYGTTNNKWDKIIPLTEMWTLFDQKAKENAAIVLTATEPFASLLRLSNPYYKYDVIWKKTIGSNQLNISHQPLRIHESILVFYKKRPTYNEQLSIGNPYKIKRKAQYNENGYNKQTSSEKNNEGFRHATSVIEVSNPRIKDGHTTQKPVELMEILIKTYSNEGDTILDCCMGHGTTGEAAIKNNRKFVGIDCLEKCMNKAIERIEKLA